MGCEMFICDNKTPPYLTLQNVLMDPLTESDQPATNIVIGDEEYQRNMLIEDIDVIVRTIKRNWYQFQNVALYDSTIGYSELMHIRETICAAFQEIIYCLHCCLNRNLQEQYISSTKSEINMFETSVIPLHELDKDFILKFLTCTYNTRSPIYLYFHTFLDINYCLTLFDALYNSKSRFVDRLKFVMGDLILLSRTNYARQNINDRSVYTCPCIKQFWLFLQIISELKYENLFWEVFNMVLENESANFSLWILQEIALLHKYNVKMELLGKSSPRIKPNYTLLENKLKIILSEANSSMMLECFHSIEPLTCDLWMNSAKIDIYQLIWDYYSKRLNVTNKNCYSINSALELIELVDNVLWCTKDCTEDFEFFIGMLLKHLREYPMHWGKIKGRIYSQLGPNKVKDLSDVGIKHVIIMFLSLSSINFEEMCKKILSFLDSLPEEKRGTSAYWNIYISLVIRHVQAGKNIQGVATKLLGLLQEASNDQKSFRQIKEFINNLEKIIDASANLNLGQCTLIDKWLVKYCAVCYYQDLNVALALMSNILEKVETPDYWSIWESAFRDHVYPSLKQISVSNSAPPVVGTMAAKLSLLIPALSTEAFNLFNSDNVSARLSAKYLGVILENYPHRFMLTLPQEIIIIQSWVKICIVNTEADNFLTKNIIKLDLFPLQLKNIIETAMDPVIAFIEYLAEHKKEPQSMKLAEYSFGQMDRWLPQHLASSNDAAILRIHSIISQAFLQCGTLLYNRNKSVCPLTQLFPILLLPTDFLMGKQPRPFIINALKKTWHVYFEALVNLNTLSDGFLERTQRDLITKYMPYFPSMDSPMIQSLENELTSEVILDKLSGCYFKHPTKETDSNVLKALKIVQDFVECTTSETLLCLVVKKTLYGLFEVVIFHAQRNAAIGVIKSITGSPLYPKIKDDVKHVIILITEKHMAFNMVNYFQLMNILSKFIPNEVTQLLEQIKTHLGVVERMRGVGFDKNLRQHMEKLESSLKKCKH